MISKFQPEKGKILISEPFMFDPHFKRAVLVLAEYENEEGSVGFVLNQPTTLLLNDIMDDFPEFNAKIYIGGPVEHDTLHFIHKLGDKLEGSKEIMPGVYWGGNFEALKVLAENNAIKPEDIRFFIGYSGWGPNQLGEELKENTWIVSQTSQEVIFSEDFENLWRTAVIELGERYAHIANFPENPYLN